MHAQTTPNKPVTDIPPTHLQADWAAIPGTISSVTFSRFLLAPQKDYEICSKGYMVESNLPSPIFIVGNYSDSEDDQPLSPSPSSYTTSNENITHSYNTLDSSFEQSASAFGGTLGRIDKGKGRAPVEDGYDAEQKDSLHVSEEEGNGLAMAEEVQQESRYHTLGIQLMEADLRYEGQTNESTEGIILEQTTPRSFPFLPTTSQFPSLPNATGKTSKSSELPASNKDPRLSEPIQIVSAGSHSPSRITQPQPSTASPQYPVIRSASLSRLRSKERILSRESESGSSRVSPAHRAASLDSDRLSSRRSSAGNWGILMRSAGRASSWPAVPFLPTVSTTGDALEKGARARPTSLRPPILSNMERACIFPESRVRYIRRRHEGPGDRSTMV